MAYVKKTWEDREAENLGGRIITDDVTGESRAVTVTPNEGVVTKEGTPLNAEEFNDLEDRIEAGFNSIPTSDVIDDTTTALDKTWSSSKINGLLILDVTSTGV